MKFVQAEYDNALDDFNNKKNPPSKQTCEILMKYHPVIREECQKALDEKLNSISIVTFGEKIIVIKNPVFMGACTTVTIMSEIDSHKTRVHFARD